MKIALDVSQTCVERAGCGWMTHSFAEALIENTPTEEFVLYHQFDRWLNESDGNGTHLSRPNVSAPFAGMRPDKAAQVWSGVRAGQPLPARPDLVHAFSHQAPALSVPLVFTVYDVSFWTHPEYTTEANRLHCQRGVLDALDRADGFHFISEFSRLEFERVLGNWLRDHDRPWKVIPLASRFATLASPVPSTARDYWLFLGSVEPRKNLGAALDAIESYFSAGGNRPLYIAGGSGWKSESINARIAKLESQGQVKRLGYVADEDLPALLSNACGLVFPSWYEGFGLPVLEAMSLACPVICSTTSSLPEIGGEAAVYIDPANPESITKAMLALEHDEALRERCINAGLARSRQMTWDAAAAEMITFYRKILSQRRSSRTVP